VIRRCPSSTRWSTACRTDIAWSLATHGTSVTSRFTTMTGRCLAVIRIAESDILVLASTIPSTVGMARSRASRSRRTDSCASESSVV
jgi:hypothetical protein